MGALSGTIAVTRYRAANTVPSGFREPFTAKLDELGFFRGDMKAVQALRMGWVTLDDENSSTFSTENFVFNEYLIFSLREDKLAIPGSTLKVFLKKAEREYLAKTGKARLLKAERDELKERVLNDLMKRAVPTVRVYDVVWNTATNEVMFWGSSPKLLERFEKLFTQTFEISITHMNHLSLVELSKLPQGKKQALLETRPSSFVLGTTAKFPADEDGDDA